MRHNPPVEQHTEPTTATVEPDGVLPDDVLLAAAEVARQAAIDEAGLDAVGEHSGTAMEGDRLAVHLFACALPGYRGWQWAVTLARVPEGDPTVCDVVLLPGTEALLAPPWVPWSERIQPGDLGVGDVLPTSANDLRLVPGFTGADEDLDGVLPSGWELGLGRVRVLSPLGRDEAADRWHDGETGPTAPMARNAAMACGTCGFLAPLGGPLGQAFGVCANRFAPADGRVVAVDYGCGAHSEVHVDEPVPALDLTGADEFAGAEESATELGHS